MNIVVLSCAHKINITGATRVVGVPTSNADRIAKFSFHVAWLPNDNRMLDPFAFFVRKSRIDIVGKNP